MKPIALYFVAVVIVSNAYSLQVPKSSGTVLESTVLRVCGINLIKMFETVCDDLRITGAFAVYLSANIVFYLFFVFYHSATLILCPHVSLYQSLFFRTIHIPGY